MARRPAMWVPAGSGWDADAAMCARLAAATDRRTVLQHMEVSPGEGIAWQVEAGQIFRITIVDEPQIADLNVWQRDDPTEHFWASRTRQLYGTHMEELDRMWSTLPQHRALATIIRDTVQYGVDDEGGRCHDLLGTRCDPYISTLITGYAFDHHCHSNLLRAAAPFGVTEQDVHDVLNVFQVTGLDDDGLYWIKGCGGGAGDYIEFLADTDLLCGVSACPGGDMSGPPWGMREIAGTVPRGPLAIDVYAPAPTLLEGWKPSSTVPYAGDHGLGA